MSVLLAICLSNPTSTVEVLQLELCSWANTGRRLIIMSINKLDTPQFFLHLILGAAYFEITGGESQ